MNNNKRKISTSMLRNAIASLSQFKMQSQQLFDEHFYDDDDIVNAIDHDDVALCARVVELCCDVALIMHDFAYTNDYDVYDNDNNNNETK